ncbi:ExbD/TolR family protein [Aureibacter tunicatorum]|uniref:Biopolymer transport protein ExbD n=1 Tax=Aureibacter tunicatorum TaxID=866807 RepID=A0AAE4BUZ6_9BACT|nr:biopolymer transporter ExbD [Aureibacter tunicatorum]MDR6241273.1 biopolymer transport protein ExbD [Aureibacter tunicatorum]BDD03533.1 biopolymer transporter ExbD [Aureibacter tunicatorum]
MKKSKRASAEVNAGSMADIAFLLLIFFLVTTTIASDKGILLLLPPKADPNEEQIDVKIKDKNLFKILVNSSDRVLVNGEPWTQPLENLKPKVQEFVLNNGRKEDLSESPKKAIVSFKTDRGTSYEKFIGILDVLHLSYNEIYAKKMGMTLEEFNNFDRKDADKKDKYDEIRKTIPKQISIAEPSKIGN